MRLYLRRLSTGSVLASCLVAASMSVPSARLPTAAAAPASTTVSFGYTGAAQSWTVPGGVTQVQVDARGAQGQSAFGGFGGETMATLAVTAGQTLGIYVGGAGASGRGGWNGGGGTSLSSFGFAAGGGG